MRKFILVFLCIVSITGAFAQTYKSPLKLTIPRMNGPEVIAIQERLIELGFSQIGPADGLFGPLTKNAVSDFQRFFGFDETGIVDSAIWKMLFQDSTKLAEIWSAIKESNQILASKHTKSSHDITSRSAEGGDVDQYFSGKRLDIEEFAFYGELGKVEYKVIHLTIGFVVLEKEYQYPKQFDIEHATIANTAYYSVGKTTVKVKNGKIEAIKIEDLPIHDLIGKTGP